MEIRSDVRMYSGIFLIILAALAVFILLHHSSPPPPQINSYEDCIKAGYPVLHSYPSQCTLPSGKFFVQQVVPEK